MIKGNKVYLSAVEEKDLEQLRYWRNLPEYRKYFREYREISRPMQEKWFSDVINGNNTTIILTGYTGILIYHCILEKIMFILIMMGLQRKAAGCYLDMLLVNWD